MTRVSVVVPCYRHERYVESCLRSVFEQCHPDLELVVIDDKSPDRTYEIASKACTSDEFKRRFSNVICVQNSENMGAHATLNRGVRMASGDYVAILNSDDLYHPKRVTSMVAALIGNERQIAFSNYTFIDEFGHEDSAQALYLELQTGLSLLWDLYPSIGFGFLEKQLVLSTRNLMFTRGLFEEIGGFLDLKYCHNWDFVLQATRITELLFVDESYYHYRIHGSNSFSSLSAITEAETDFVLKRYFRMCEAKGVPNPHAPWRQNWPGLFEILLERMGLMGRYQKAITGYYPWHRIAELGGPNDKAVGRSLKI